MTLEIRPSGIECNLRCKYCYQNFERDNGQGADKVKDLESFKKRIDRKFVLFGGEPLVTDKEKLEDLFKHGKKHFGGSGIQTNGSLIDDDHIEMFKKYNVHVGISIDGKGKLNDYRWAGNLEKTRELTKRTSENIEKLINEGLSVSIIATLHRQNASEENLELFKEWLWEMNDLGVGSMRLHVLEQDGDNAERLALTMEENLKAFKEALEVSEDPDFTMRLDVYKDIINLLKGDDNRVTCTWKKCDVWNTASVTDLSVNGANGCGRPHKDGQEWTKHDKPPTAIREIMLYNTPQEYGGCKGCRFFSICKGQCAGTGLDGDWRNRSQYCEMFKELFKLYEKKLEAVNITPVTKLPYLDEIERRQQTALKEGKNITIERIIHQIKNEKNGNNNSCKIREESKNNMHLDNPHQDKIRHKDHMDRE